MWAAAVHFLVGNLHLPSQWQVGGPTQLPLSMEQVGSVLRLQAVAGTGDQSLGLIAGHLDHLNGQAGQRLLQGRCPGAAVTLRPVGFQEQVIGLGFHGHQARLAAVEVFVQAGADLLGQHVGSQMVRLLVRIGDQRVLEADGHSLLGSEGGGDEAVQLRQFQKATQGPQSAVADEMEDQVQGDDESAQETIAAGAIQKGDECGFEVGFDGAAVAEPVSQGRAWHAVVTGELALGGGRLVGVAEIVACLDGFGVCPAEGAWAEVRGWSRLSRSHGSCPCTMSGGKDTVGKRAMLVQGPRGQPCPRNGRKNSIFHLSNLYWPNRRSPPESV